MARHAQAQAVAGAEGDGALTKLSGFCAQTVGEVAAVLRAGCQDVLLTNAVPEFGAKML